MAKSRKILLNCIVCGEAIEAYPSDVERGRGKYCSAKCAKHRYKQRKPKPSKPKSPKQKYREAIALWARTPDIWDKCRGVIVYDTDGV